MRSLILTLILFFSVNTYAQLPSLSKETKEEKQEKPEVSDELERDNPRSMTEAFLSSLAKQDYTKSSQYLNVDQKNTEKNLETVKHIQSILDKAGTMKQRSFISNDPEGNTKDNLAENLEKIGTVKTAKKEFYIIIERVSLKKEQTMVWLMTASTIKKIKSISDAVVVSLLDKYMPLSLLKNFVWGVPIGHWIALISLAAISYFLMWGIALGLQHIFYYLRKVPKEDRGRTVMHALIAPVQLYTSVVLFLFVANRIGVSIVARQNFSNLAEVTAWILFAWILWRLIDVFADNGRRRLIKKGQYGVISTIIFLRRSAKFALITILTITILDSFGFRVTTWLAALGIGGLAIALGAQKTVENLVGSLTLIADRPISIGDLCKFGDTVGVVEDIGMRSTRVRTANHTVITIPNGDFSSMRIENYSLRDNFLFSVVLKFQHTTTIEQIKALLIEFRKFLSEHPKIKNDYRVSFIGFDVTSLNIEISADIITRNFGESMTLKEEFNFKIMEIIRDSGTSLAIPLYNVVLENKENGEN